jgi:hypothetical protein
MAARMWSRQREPIDLTDEIAAPDAESDSSPDLTEQVPAQRGGRRGARIR